MNNIKNQLNLKTPVSEETLSKQLSYHKHSMWSWTVALCLVFAIVDVLGSLGVAATWFEPSVIALGTILGGAALIMSIIHSDNMSELAPIQSKRCASLLSMCQDNEDIRTYCATVADSGREITRVEYRMLSSVFKESNGATPCQKLYSLTLNNG